MKRKLLLITLSVIFVALTVTGIAFAINSNGAVGDDISAAVTPPKTVFEDIAQGTRIKDMAEEKAAGIKEELSNAEHTSVEENNALESEQRKNGASVNGNGSNGTNSDTNTPLPQEPVRTGLAGLNRDADIIYIDYFIEGYPQKVMDTHAKTMALKLLDAVEYRSPEKWEENGEEVAGFTLVMMIVQTEKGPVEITFCSSWSRWDIRATIREGDGSFTYYAASRYYYDTIHELSNYLYSLRAEN
jgi:hypothetical protein